MQAKKERTALKYGNLNSETWLNAIVNNSDMGVLVLEAIRNNNNCIIDFEIVFVNDRMEELLRRQELIGKSLIGDLSYSFLSGQFHKLVEVTEKGGTWRNESDYSESNINCLLSVKATGLENGCMVTCTGISQKKPPERESSVQKEMLSAALDGLPFQLMIFRAETDVKGKVTGFRSIFQNKSSITPDSDFPAGSWPPAVREDNGNSTFNIFLRVFETGVPEERELLLQVNGHEKRFIQSVVRYGDGITTTITAVGSEGDQMLEAPGNKGDAIDKIIGRYNVLFNSIDQGYCTIRVKFDNNGTPVDYLFLETSPSFEHQTGIVNGKGRWMREIAPAQDEFWFIKYGSVVINQKPERFEYFSTPLKRWWSVYAFPVDEPELHHVGVLFDDITQRKKEELEKEKLFLNVAKEKAVLKATLDALPLAVWIADRKGEIIQHNRQALNMWGAEGAYARDIQDYQKFKGWWIETGEQLKPEDWAMSRALMKGEYITGDEIEIERFDGQRAFMLNNAAPVRDESGNIIGGVTIGQNITERKKIERKLRAAEARNAFLLKLSDSLNFIDDPVQIQYKAVQLLGKHLGASRAGYAEDGGDGTTVTVTKNYINGVPGIEGTYTYENYGPLLLQELKKGRTVVRNDIYNDSTLTLEEKEQHRILQLGATLNKPLIKHGKLTAILFVHFSEKHQFTDEEISLIDETAERTWAAVEWARAEEALLKAEENYRKRLEQEVEKRTAELIENKQFTQLITDSMPDILFVYDIKKWQIIYVNKGITTILGYLPQEVYASGRKDFESMLHPDDLKRRISEMARMVYLKPGEVRESEFRIKDRYGSVHWLNVRDIFFKANNKGKTVQVLSICQDVTEKTEIINAYRKELNRSKELKRMNELMDTFVFAAAHDLKAPVSNLKLLTQVIENTPQPDKKLLLQNKYSDIIETLDAIISGLVRVLAVEKDYSPGAKRVHFKKMLTRVISDLQEDIQRVNPEIHFDFSECKSVYYNESYIYSIFRNMISNSMDFRSSGKKLNIDIRSGCEQTFTWLSFSDNGTGIDLEQFGSDLFKPFKRFTSKPKGSGLGLHLLKSIVTKNGGDILVESKKLEGTTFKVFLVPYKEENND